MNQEISDLKDAIKEEVAAIYLLSNDKNIVSISGRSFKIECVGRGSDIIGLWCDRFTEPFQIEYMEGILVELAKIKKDLIGENE